LTDQKYDAADQANHAPMVNASGHGGSGIRASGLTPRSRRLQANANAANSNEPPKAMDRT